MNGAVVEIDGVRSTLPLASAPGLGRVGADRITIAADARGQFLTDGSVNGRPMKFLVDTGATVTALSRGDAKRLGLDYGRGKLTVGMTAGGAVRGWRITLASVKVGDVSVRDVDALVIDNDSLAFGLLGMSFLDRFDMQRQGPTLVLRRRR
jgi:aspartyl protease family protein